MVREPGRSRRYKPATLRRNVRIQRANVPFLESEIQRHINENKMICDRGLRYRIARWERKYGDKERSVESEDDGDVEMREMTDSKPPSPSTTTTTSTTSVSASARVDPMDVDPSDEFSRDPALDRLPSLELVKEHGSKQARLVTCVRALLENKENRLILFSLFTQVMFSVILLQLAVCLALKSYFCSLSFCSVR